MKRMFAGLVVVVTLLAAAGPAFAYDDGGDYGNGNDQRHCHESQNCRGSFSPGPFDRSPVDIHDNQVCISPDCSHKGDDKSSPAPPKDQKPQQLFPPNPSKFPMIIQGIIKAGLDLGQLFANGTIKFVEDLFMGLANVPVWRYI